MVESLYGRGISGRAKIAIALGVLVLSSICGGFVLSRKGLYDDSNERSGYPTPPPTIVSSNYLLESP